MYIALIVIVLLLGAAIVTQRRASAGRLLTVGSNAPDFELPDQDGNVHRLKDYAGKLMVLVFYPVDTSPACSLEMARITGQYSGFQQAGAEVVGISVQGGDSHKRFCGKIGIPYALLSDTKRIVSKAYGATGSDKGIADRVTFIVDKSGKIAYVDPDVDMHMFSIPGLWIDWIKSNQASL